MKSYKQKFLEICIANNILQFGEFTLKSGRISPYFFNAGLFNNGKLLGDAASCYANLITDSITEDFMLYGPAYKGIPLVATIAVQLDQQKNQNINYAFNRKEEKDHGEGGRIVGAALTDNIVIVDDVITAGTSINESVKIIDSHNARFKAVVIALDRQEVADGESLSAVQKIEKQYGIPVFSLLKLKNLVDFAQQSNQYNDIYDSISEYQSSYGCNEL